MKFLYLFVSCSVGSCGLGEFLSDAGTGISRDLGIAGVLGLLERRSLGSKGRVIMRVPSIIDGEAGNDRRHQGAADAVIQHEAEQLHHTIENHAHRCGEQHCQRNQTGDAASGSNPNPDLPEFRAHVHGLRPRSTTMMMVRHTATTPNTANTRQS